MRVLGRRSQECEYFCNTHIYIYIYSFFVLFILFILYFYRHFIKGCMKICFALGMWKPLKTFILHLISFNYSFSWHLMYFDPLATNLYCILPFCVVEYVWIEHFMWTWHFVILLALEEHVELVITPPFGNNYLQIKRVCNKKCLRAIKSKQLNWKHTIVHSVSLTHFPTPQSACAFQCVFFFFLNVLHIKM